jgi:Protein of unknown function (DUF2281)
MPIEELIIQEFTLLNEDSQMQVLQYIEYLQWRNSSQNSKAKSAKDKSVMPDDFKAPLKDLAENI